MDKRVEYSGLRLTMMPLGEPSAHMESAKGTQVQVFFGACIAKPEALATAAATLG